jgi:hypothetical protein
MFAEIRYAASRGVHGPARAPQGGQVGGVSGVRRDVDVAGVHDRGAPRDVNQSHGVADLVGDHDGESITGKIIIDEDLAARGVEEAVRERGRRLKVHGQRNARRAAVHREARLGDDGPRADRGANARLLVGGRADVEGQPDGPTGIEADRVRAGGRGSAASCCERKDERKSDEDGAQTSGHVSRRS